MDDGQSVETTTTATTDAEASARGRVSAVLDALAGNGLGGTFLALAVIGVLVLGLSQGCDSGNFIRVQTPPTVRARNADIPPSMTLNDSLALYEAWKANTLAQDREWAKRLSKAAEFQSILGSLQTDALAYATPFLGGLPGGSLMVGALGALGGLFLPKPGTQRRIDAAYDMGRTETEKTVQAVGSGAGAGGG